MWEADETDLAWQALIRGRKEATPFNRRADWSRQSIRENPLPSFLPSSERMLCRLSACRTEYDKCAVVGDLGGSGGTMAPRSVGRRSVGRIVGADEIMTGILCLLSPEETAETAGCRSAAPAARPVDHIARRSQCPVNCGLPGAKR